MYCTFYNTTEMDETERYDFWTRFLLLHSPFLFPPKKRGKRKGEWCSKNRDQKSYLPVSSWNVIHFTIEKNLFFWDFTIVLLGWKYLHFIMIGWDPWIMKGVDHLSSIEGKWRGGEGLIDIYWFAQNAALVVSLLKYLFYWNVLDSLILNDLAKSMSVY